MEHWEDQSHVEEAWKKKTLLCLGNDIHFPALGFKLTFMARWGRHARTVDAHGA